MSVNCDFQYIDFHNGEIIVTIDSDSMGSNTFEFDEVEVEDLYEKMKLYFED